MPTSVSYVEITSDTLSPKQRHTNISIKIGSKGAREPGEGLICVASGSLNLNVDTGDAILTVRPEDSKALVLSGQGRVLPRLRAGTTIGQYYVGDNANGPDRASGDVRGLQRMRRTRTTSTTSSRGRGLSVTYRVSREHRSGRLLLLMRVVLDAQRRYSAHGSPEIPEGSNHLAVSVLR
ncbi:hypothetical protein PG993_007332 [Apiospora rasikravindrae]|uniref:Uncharacterized protein n=1 Tax=Apiospora rasikravindrae TaxID=990691 RepID=A0ABR1SX73_9PEZI